MGLYDTILVECPNCGTEHEFQSKSGKCMMRTYTLHDCPKDVMFNANRHSPRECDCGISFEVDIEKRKAKIITNE